MVKLEDTLDLSSSIRKDVRVQIPLGALWWNGGIGIRKRLNPFGIIFVRVQISFPSLFGLVAELEYALHLECSILRVRISPRLFIYDSIV